MSPADNANALVRIHIPSGIRLKTERELIYETNQKFGNAAVFNAAWTDHIYRYYYPVEWEATECDHSHDMGNR